MTDPGMSVQVAADRYGTDPAGIWEMVADGYLTAEKPGDGEPWVIRPTTVPIRPKRET